MPKLSPTMEEGQISRWLKNEGDKVSMGEPLAEIDTDKATMEMQALGNGVLRKIIIQAGESAPLGQLIAVIGEPDEDISALLSQAGSAPKQAQAAPQPQAGGGEAKAEAPAEGTAPAPAQSSPSGNGAQAAKGDGEGQATGRLVVSPLAARMAAEAGINLRTLTGSGPGGRIIKRDIEAAMSAGKPSEEAAQAPQRHLRAVQPGTQPTEAPAVEGASAYRDEPTSVMRQTIARRLVTSIGPVPHFFLTTEIEMDRVVEMRNSLKELDPEVKFSINDVIVKVAAAALGTEGWSSATAATLMITSLMLILISASSSLRRSHLDDAVHLYLSRQEEVGHRPDGSDQAARDGLAHDRGRLVAVRRTRPRRGACAQAACRAGRRAGGAAALAAQPASDACAC